MDGLKAQLLHEKTLEFLVGKAEITEIEGQ
jgi:hypothetical protein